jgi:sulfate adenylyltransferase subunit 1
MANTSGLVQLESTQREDSSAQTDLLRQTEADTAQFDIDAYLGAERAKDLLRFSTAGSVDDGKSTLIGRLLYDTQSVYDDQVRAIEGKGTTAPGVLDLALLTDGLRAEREQGITIDVAYRYFATARRKFIIADTPGHEQYTRNMATGASTADVAIVLVDARKGVLIQSRRHAYITALLGVRNVIVAVNKMDLVAYTEEVFREIVQQFTNFFTELAVAGVDATRLHFVPVSALAGDNVVHGSSAMPWYHGPTLLELLETLPSAAALGDAPFRMAVQRVVRPNLDFRGFAGQIASGRIRPGDRVTVLPSRQSSRVTRIVTYDGDLAEATAPLSVTLTFEDEIDISRGDLIASAEHEPRVATNFDAALVWMDSAPLELNRRYSLKIGSRTVPAQVQELLSTIDLASAPDQLPGRLPSATLNMNGLGTVRMQSVQPVALDAYADNRRTGSFILIDPQTNATVAAGMVQTQTQTTKAHGSPTRNNAERVSAAEREARYGHRGAHIILRGSAEIADALERALFERGALVLRVENRSDTMPHTLIELGVLVLTVAPVGEHRASLEVWQDGRTSAIELDGDPQQILTRVFTFLFDERVLQIGDSR